MSRSTRMAVASCALLWFGASFGLIQAELGRPPPGHPWVEIGFVPLGLVSLLAAGPWVREDRRWRLIRLVLAILTLVAGVLWVKAAFPATPA